MALFSLCFVMLLLDSMSFLDSAMLVEDVFVVSNTQNVM